MYSHCRLSVRSLEDIRQTDRGGFKLKKLVIQIVCIVKIDDIKIVFKSEKYYAWQIVCKVWYSKGLRDCNS